MDTPPSVANTFAAASPKHGSASPHDNMFRGVPTLLLSVVNIDHACLGMLGAELCCFAAGHAVAHPLFAPWTATPLGSHVDHAFLGVLGAELALLAAGHAETRQSAAL